MAAGELACSYATLILHNDRIPITAEKISALVKAANVPVESYWPSLFAKLSEKRSIDDFLTSVGAGGGAAPVEVAAAPAASSAPAAEEKKEEEKEESDNEMVGGLFDD